MSEDISMWDSMFGITSSASSTTQPPPTTTTLPDVTITVTPTPTPTADGGFWDEGLAYEFEIYNIVGWVTDGGANLETQEKGCVL
jgi:chitinase